MDLIAAVAERQAEFITLWKGLIVFGALLVLSGIVFSVLGIGKDVKPQITISNIGGIKDAPLSVVTFVGGILVIIFAALSLRSELEKPEPSRCGEVDVGKVDESRDRQPSKGTACINGDQAATFLEGGLRVTVREIRDRRIGSAILETAGEDGPILSPCPATGPRGMGAGDVASLEYTQPPDAAGRKDSHRWTLHVEEVRGDSAEVFVTHETFTYAGDALRDLRRRRPRGLPSVGCSASDGGQFVITGGEPG